MSWHYLLGEEEVSSDHTSSDGTPSLRSSSGPTAGKSSSNGSAKAASQGSPSGTTSRPSTGDLGVDSWILSLEASRAKTCRSPARKPGSKAPGAGSGPRWQELPARFDLDTCGWKTHRSLFDEDLHWSSVTLPRWGMMRSGGLWERPTPALPTYAKERGSLPTPTLNDSKNSSFPPSQKDRDSIIGYLLSGCPTPTASDARRGVETQMAKRLRNSKTGVTLNDHCRVTGGCLNPHLHQWLMGWPLGWTSLQPLGTDRFRRWCELHGTSCPAQPESPET